MLSSRQELQLIGNGLQHHAGEQSPFMEGKGEQRGDLSESPRAGQSPAAISYPLINYLDVLVFTIIAQEKNQSSNIIVLNKYVNHTETVLFQEGYFEDQITTKQNKT